MATMTPAQVQKIVRMRLAGASWRAIAAEVRKNVEVVHRYGAAAGAPVRTSREVSRRADEKALEALRHRRAGTPSAEIGRRLGVTSRRADYLIKRGRAVEERHARTGRI